MFFKLNHTIIKMKNKIIVITNFYQMISLKIKYNIYLYGIQFKEK